MNNKQDYDFIIAFIIMAILWYIWYLIVSIYPIWGTFFVIACIIAFQYWVNKWTTPKNQEKVKIKESIEPSKEKNISQKIPVDVSNNKYLKKALEDQERGKMTRDLLEYTEKEIEDEKAMIEWIKQDYKEWKYNEVLDFNQMYMWNIHTNNIVEYLWVVASSMLQIWNEKGFKWYVAGIITMVKSENYTLEKVREFDGLNPEINKKLNIVIDILEQYNIDYNFSKKSFLRILTKEELDKSLRSVTQMFLLP